MAVHPTIKTKLLYVDGCFARREGNRVDGERLLDETLALAREIDDRLIEFEVAVERRHFDAAEALARREGWLPRLARVERLRRAS